jgi:hypothetical protein
MSQPLLYQSGITTEGKRVVSGLYKLYETIGLPLDIILSVFHQKDWIPDWINFYCAALSAGMRHTRIISKLQEAISDVYGSEWSDIITSKLNTLQHKDSQ